MEGVDMGGNCQGMGFPVCPQCRCGLLESAETEIAEWGTVVHCEQCGCGSMVYVEPDGSYSSYCFSGHNWHMLNGCKVCSLCGVEDEGGV